MNPSDFQTLALAWLGVMIVLVPSVFLVFRSVVTQFQQLQELLHQNGVKTDKVQQTLTNGGLSEPMKAAMRSVLHESSSTGGATPSTPSGVDSSLPRHLS
jgi:hypothetical protein